MTSGGPVRLVALWGTGGVLALLFDAVRRLAPRALTLAELELDGTELLGLVASLVFFGAVEGYRGFQKGFSPRVVARAWALDARAPVLLRALAPLFAMGLIAATPRRLLVSWGLVLMIVGFVVALRFLPSPWREIVDAGVVLGLSWGALSLLVFTARALRGAPPRVPLDWPGAPSS